MISGPKPLVTNDMTLFSRMVPNGSVVYFLAKFVIFNFSIIFHFIFLFRTNPINMFLSVFGVFLFLLINI